MVASLCTVIKGKCLSECPILNRVSNFEQRFLQDDKVSAKILETLMRHLARCLREVHILPPPIFWRFWDHRSWVETVPTLQIFKSDFSGNPFLRWWLCRGAYFSRKFSSICVRVHAVGELLLNKIKTLWKWWKFHKSYDSVLARGSNIVEEIHT